MSAELFDLAEADEGGELFESRHLAETPGGRAVGAQVLEVLAKPGHQGSAPTRSGRAPARSPARGSGRSPRAKRGQ